MKIVEVMWWDAWQDEEEYTLEDVEREHRPYLQQSVGMLVKKDDEGVTLAACRSEHNTFQRVMFIPSGMIETIKVLRRG